MDEQVHDPYSSALDTAERLLGFRLEPFLELGPGEPANGADFTRLATLHAFGDAWSREGVLDVRTRALVSVTIAATLGTIEPLRGQLRIALNNGVTPAEIVEVFIHLEAYAGAARAFEGYQVAREVFAERAASGSLPEEES
jgi:4-carboxymuconolactone decarboxylase